MRFSWEKQYRRCCSDLTRKKCSESAKWYMPLTIKRKEPRKNLVYTIAFDAPNSESYRFLGKMLASSLLRTFFTGDIMVFRNSPAPLFLVERKGLEEVYLETPPLHGQERAEWAWGWKYKVAELIDPEPYDKVLFLDCDSLALRNIDHLLEGTWDIRYQPERGKAMSGKSFNAFLTEEEMDPAAKRDGANSGTLAVRAEIFHDVVKKWAQIDESNPLRPSGFRDQASWNKLLLTCGAEGGEVGGGGLSGGGSALGGWRTEPFPGGEVQFPCYLDPHYANYSKAAITHNVAANTKEKVEFTFGLYMRTFFCDPTGVFFSMLEM